MTEVLKWGGRELTKAEVDYLNEALDKILLQIAELTVEIKELINNVGRYVEEQKNVGKAMMKLGEKLEKLPDKKLLKELEAVKIELVKRMPTHYILQRQLKHPDIVELMKRIAEEQRQQVELPSLIRDILKGKKKASDYAVEVMKQMEGEKHG